MDESEEERTHGKDDGFGDVESLPAAAIGPSQPSFGSPTSPNSQPTIMPPQTTPGGSRIMINGTYYRVKNRAKRTPKKRNDPSSSAPPEDVGQLSDGYVTEELNSSDPDEDGEESCNRPKYDRFKPQELNKDYQFKVGLEFGSLDEFRAAIREWFILNGREIEFAKNESYRVRVYCKHHCGFVALVSRVGHTQTFRMKTWDGTHNCGRVLNNSSARSSWVAKSVARKLLTTDNVKIREIISDIRVNYKAGITYGRAQRARKMARQMVEGDADKQYALLWRYAAELKRVNTGNTCKINMVRPLPELQPRFGSFYFCFNGCKQGFLKGCRPFVCVDGCHLKTKYGGQLLVAVGRDPNDQYYPLAFGVIETETKETWRWFLTLLLEDIGQDKRWIFISDQQKGLIQVFEEMGLEHRLCVMHLYANCKKKFGGGTIIRDLMMGASKATYYQAWEQKMKELKEVDAKCWEWLMVVPTKFWCKHAFPHYPKCDIVMNNLAEGFNSTILTARDKPILTMCEWIREYLMGRIAKQRVKLEAWPHRVMPKPRKRLDHEVEGSANWLAMWTGIGLEFQINHVYGSRGFIVDLNKMTCSCNFWQLVGIPCRHACAAICERQKKPEDFVDTCYSRYSYELAYNYGVSAINGQDMWPTVEVEDMLPPIYKRGPGRPQETEEEAT